MSLRAPLFLLGLLVSIQALMMGIPATVDLLAGHPNWRAFATSGVICLFVGVALAVTNLSTVDDLRPRQAVFFIVMAWLCIGFFGAGPFYFSIWFLSPVDAIFESISGITTTGATVIEHLQFQSKGLLLWRAMLQWVGGIGFVIMAASILPALQIGGMQLFHLETSDRSEKIMPRADQIIKRIGLVYLLLTILCIVGYALAGMSTFDAVAHALTTVSTGGYSTQNDSLAAFNSSLIEWWAILFMVLGSLPFVLYARAFAQGPQVLAHDGQVRTMLLIMACGVGLCLVMLVQLPPSQTGVDAQGLGLLRLIVFNIVSVMTGTGYASAAYDTWGAFAVPVFFFLMLLGGCAGSTTCGIKVFRLQVMFQTLTCQLKKVSSPRMVAVPVFDGRPIGDDVVASVMGFFFLFATSLAITAAALGLMGLDFLTCLSAAASALANVGPGLGDLVGPASTYASLPDGAKWILCVAMLLGRLEFLTFLALLTRRFWAR
ncbi:MAG: TrkH family potassium uptake protein [Pseudomonadota bacterium]